MRKIIASLGLVVLLLSSISTFAFATTAAEPVKNPGEIVTPFDYKDYPSKPIITR